MSGNIWIAFFAHVAMAWTNTTVSLKHHPDMEVSYNRVVVKLQNHDAGGITDKDFELAAKLDQVVLWRPNGALTGPPKSQQVIKHEE